MLCDIIILYRLCTHRDSDRTPFACNPFWHLLKTCSLTSFPSCSSFQRWYGFQPDVWNGARLPGHGPRRSARLHSAATAGKRPAACVTKAGQSVRIHGLPRQVNLQITYFIHSSFLIVSQNVP